jgi:histidine triad (HIT) family protein
MNCLFCKISQGEIPANIVYRDDFVVAFDDLHPQAPQHKLIVPHKHIATLNDAHVEDNEVIGHMNQTAKMLAKQFNFAEQGYRLVLNCNAAAGQTVFHLHLHLLGGRSFSWPPG